MADAGGLVVLAADVTTSDDDNEAGNAFPQQVKLRARRTQRCLGSHATLAYGDAADPSNPALFGTSCHGM